MIGKRRSRSYFKLSDIRGEQIPPGIDLTIAQLGISKSIVIFAHRSH